MKSRNRHYLFLVILYLLLCKFVHAYEVNKIDDYKIAERFSISSKVFNEEREFYVSLPENYEKTSGTYPVLILLDGDLNLEHSVASSRMQAKWKGLPEIIIVAIPSPNRIRDFTPTANLNYSKDSGGAKKFQSFIENEVMSFVDKSYRSHPFRVLEGHSLGGLFAATQIVNRNEYYQAFVIVAPALWWHDYGIFKLLEENKKRLYKAPTFFGIGEFDGNGMKQELSQFYDELLKNNVPTDLLNLKVYPEEGHMSAPMLSTYDGLLHTFKATKFGRERWDTFSSESFKDFIVSTKQKYGSNVVQSAELYVDLAQYLSERQNFEGAITVLKENIKSYPKYPYNHDLLANVYVLNNQVDLAIEEYKKAIQYANESGTYGDGFAQGYRNEIARLQNPVEITPELLELYQGCYESDSGRKLMFRIKSGQLVGSREGWTDFRLFPESESSFYTRTEPRLPYKFSSGKLEVFVNGQTFTFTKVICSSEN